MGGHCCKILVECPDCGKSRPVDKYRLDEPRFTGVCKSCASSRTASLKTSGNTGRDAIYCRGLDARKERAKGWVAPCGSLLASSVTVEVVEGSGVWRGRCSREAATYCDHYTTCLDMAVELGWPGWRMVKGKPKSSVSANPTPPTILTTHTL